MQSYINQLDHRGYTIIQDVFKDTECNQILEEIDRVDVDKSTFRKMNDLFAIRQFLKEVPAAQKITFNDRLKKVIGDIFGKDYFCTKSIYFDKPEQSNWFVSYHQDLTISVDKKLDLDGFGPWSVKQNQYAVQPPLDILQNNFTIRLHLDDTGEHNGALKVIPGSHRKGIYRPDTINWGTETEHICAVPRGGIMIMKPLLLHSSARSRGNYRRRVVHLEFSNGRLPESLNWSEFLNVFRGEDDEHCKEKACST